MTSRSALILVTLAGLIAGCDQLGIETPAQENARLEAEGKAIGSSCRQSGRALEDCYQINPKAPKAAIFTGWREMDAYMRENKIEEVKPQFPMSPKATKKKGQIGEAPEAADSHATDSKSSSDSHAPAEKAEKTEKPAEEKAGETKPSEPPAKGKAEEKPVKKTALPGHRTT